MIEQGLDARPSTNYDPAARHYDAARPFDPHLLRVLFNNLRDAGCLPPHGQLLDAGCGTGQLAIPLAELGYTVTGLDISPQMLVVARAKTAPHLAVNYRVCDVQKICYPAAHFDGGVASRLFMHVGNWSLACRELLRVTKPGGTIILVNGGGFMENAVQKKCTQIAGSLGYRKLFKGTDNEAAVHQFLLTSGCTYNPAPPTALATQQQTTIYGEVYRQIEERAFARYWAIPKADYAAMLAELRSWIELQPQGMATQARITERVGVHIFVAPTHEHTHSSQVAHPAALLRDARQRDWLAQSVPDRFEKIVEQFPHHTAIRTLAETLTYDQLNRRANQLAHRLIDQSGSAAEPVAVLLADDVATVVALFAVCKVGKFSVFIDPARPLADSRAIFADAQASLLIADHRNMALATALIADADSPCDLVTLEQTSAHFPATNPHVALTPELYAQIVYTAGSTGHPKGVIKTHSMHLYAAMVHAYGTRISVDDRMMVPTPILFGTSLTVTFTALLTGAVLVPYNTRERDIRTLGRWLHEEKITIYQSVATLFRQFAATLSEGEHFPHIRIIKLGGEAIYRHDIELFRQHFGPHCTLRVGLASTETGPFCWNFVDQETHLDSPIVPVGYTLPDKDILLWNEDRQPVPLGETGMIAIRSRHLSPGYWRNPTLTADTFLPDPEGSDKRVFVSGDLGRFRPDGMLEHLGRADDMVKIRGYRVELAFVEGALREVPGVQEAAVIGYSDEAGHFRLVAYVTSTRGQVTTSQLRGALLSVLPDYMIPARFVWLPQLPLLPGGKVDRKALPPPGKAHPNLDTPFVAPRTDLEQQIADIWAELLELDAVGVEDNFFELGGDSLLAMHMLLTVEKSLGGRVPTEFFSEPTVAHLTWLMSRETATEAAKQQPTILRSSVSVVRQAERFTPRNLVRHLTQTGPLWRGHALPYSLGVRIQRLWIRTPFLRQRLQQRATALQQWLNLVGCDDLDGRELELSLLANTWRFWREACVQQPATFVRWVAVRGAAHLDAALGDGRSIILVGMHTAIRNAALKMAIRQHSGRSVWTLGYSPTGLIDAVAKVGHARTLLAQGGIVQVTGDGAQGTRGLELPIYGRLWLFRSGGAELALDMNAILLPVFSTLAHNGYVTVEFTEPLMSAQNARQEQIEDLTRQYAALMTARWLSLLSNMKWDKLQQMLDYADRRTER